MSETGGRRMIIGGTRRWVAVLVTLAALTAVATSGCGRKGDLEPPRGQATEPA